MPTLGGMFVVDSFGVGVLNEFVFDEIQGTKSSLAPCGCRIDVCFHKNTVLVNKMHKRSSSIAQPDRKRKFIDIGSRH